MKTFREWLRETEKEKVQIIKEHEYYTEAQLMKDIKIYDSFQRMERAHEMSNEEKYNLNWVEETIRLNENIIEPNKIHISSTDLENLNSKFNKFDIFFSRGNELRAVYKQEKDEIEVFVSLQDETIEIEALLSHEMVHKEQNKRSNGNYFKECKKMISRVNVILDKKRKLISEPGGILLHRDEIKELENEIKENYLVFTHLNPFEEMAYACQAVIEYSKKYSKINDIINHLIQDKFPITNRFKKYLYMYWLIRDKI